MMVDWRRVVIRPSDTIPLVVCLLWQFAVDPSSLLLVPYGSFPHTQLRRTLTARCGQQGEGGGKVRCSAMQKHTHTHTARSSAVCCLSHPTASHHIPTRLALSLSLAPQTRSLVRPRRQGVRRRERRVSNDQSCPLSLCVARVIPSVVGWIGLQTQKCDRNDLAPTIAAHQ